MTVVVVRETPWSAFSRPVEPGMTPQEIRLQTGLLWNVELTPLYFDLRGTKIAAPRKAMYRTDTLDVLDIVGPEYEPTQNDTILERFQSYGELSEVGSLWTGRYIWGLIPLPAPAETLKAYRLAAYAHRYGKGFINKLLIEHEPTQSTFTTTFTNRTEVKTFAKLVKTLSAVTLTEAEVTKVLTGTFRLRTKEAPDERIRGSRKLARVRELYHAEEKPTAWSLLTSVMHFVDHEAGWTDDTRLRNTWFGAGEAIKHRARTALERRSV